MIAINWNEQVKNSLHCYFSKCILATITQVSETVCQSDRKLKLDEMKSSSDKHTGICLGKNIALNLSIVCFNLYIWCFWDPLHFTILVMNMWMSDILSHKHPGELWSKLFVCIKMGHSQVVEVESKLSWNHTASVQYSFHYSLIPWWGGFPHPPAETPSIHCPLWDVMFHSLVLYEKNMFIHSFTYSS